MTRKLITAVTCAALSCGFSGALAQESEPFQVIVHPSNASPALLATDVGKLFAKERQTWPHDDELAVDPVDLVRDSAVRDAFSRVVHGKSAAAVSSQWLRQMVAGTGVGPPEKSSDAEVVAHVRATPGAIGYVAAGTAIDGARRLPLLQAKPRLVERVLPRYPEQAIKLKVEASVTVLVTLDSTGEVVEAKAIETRDTRGRDLGKARGFARAAEKAVEAWRYEPPRWRGEAIGACFEESINFSL